MTSKKLLAVPLVLIVVGMVYAVNQVTTDVQGTYNSKCKVVFNFYTTNTFNSTKNTTGIILIDLNGGQIFNQSYTVRNLNASQTLFVLTKAYPDTDNNNVYKGNMTTYWPNYFSDTQSVQVNYTGSCIGS